MKSLYLAGIFYLFVFTLWGCKLPAPAPSGPVVVSSPAPSPASSVTGSISLSWGDHPQWSARLIQRIGEQIQIFSGASDITHFCPTYAALPTSKKSQVIAEMFVRIAKWESNYHPTDTFQEPPPPKGPGTLSIGLFQMSYGDGDGCPSSKTQGDLMDPLVNIDCAVNKAVALVKKYGVISQDNPHRGMTRYWFTIRASGHLADIQAHTQRICQ